MNLLQILLDHLLEILHDMHIVHGHAVEGFFDFVGVEDKLAVVGDVLIDEVDVLVGGEEHHQGACQVAHGGTVDMVVLEPEMEHSALADLTLDVHAAAHVLGVHLDQRQS